MSGNTRQRPPARSVLDQPSPEDDQWEGHPDVQVSEEELALLIAQDYRSGRDGRR